MAVNFKMLKSFVTAVELGSLSAAATRLTIAQPALSQHIANLEAHFHHKLLHRSNVGVTPTEAGAELLRHARLILSNLEQAERELFDRGEEEAVSGTVSVGLATYSTASILSMPLLQQVRREYPGVNLYLNDSFGLVFSELVIARRMDMAVIYAAGPIKGVSLQPLMTESLCLIAPADMILPDNDGKHVSLASLAHIGLLLPSRRHFLRSVIDKAFDAIGVVPRVTAEIESAATLRQAIDMGLGATILPAMLTEMPPMLEPPQVLQIVEPRLESMLYLCVNDNRELSRQADAVLKVLRAQISELFA